MSCTPVRFQLISLAILTAANVTFVRFLAGMRINVIREFCLHAETQLAEVAFELLYTGMSISVYLETPGSSVALAAIFAFVGPDTCKLRQFYAILHIIFSYILQF